MRSTRSSALRCPSWRRNTLTICSRLLDRLPPSGFSRLRSGRLLFMAVLVSCRARTFCAARTFFVRRGPFRSAVPLNAEGAAAPARGCGVRILDREAAAGHGIDKVDLGALEVTDAHRVDEELHAVRLVHLVAGAAAFLDHEPVLKARAAASLHEHAQPAADLAFFREQLADFRGCRRGYIHHIFDSPGGTSTPKNYKPVPGTGKLRPDSRELF